MVDCAKAADDISSAATPTPHLIEKRFMPTLREPTLENQTTAELQNALLPPAAGDLPERAWILCRSEMCHIPVRLAITRGIQNVEPFDTDLKLHAVWQLRH